MYNQSKITMKKFKLIVSGAVAFACMAVATSCSSNDEPVINDPDANEPVVEGVMPSVPVIRDLNLSGSQFIGVEATNKLSVKLFNAVANNYDECITDAKRNMSVSPFSISTLLSMSANCYDESTADAIVSAFGYQNIDEMNDAMAQVNAFLMTNGNTGMDFKVSNSLWWRNEYRDHLDKDILKVLTSKYYTYNLGVDFMNDETIDDINTWVSDNTNKKILNFLNYFDDAEKLTVSNVNVNTVYVNSEWATKFDKAKTAEGTFHGEATDTKVDMMHGEIIAGYAKTDDYTCVRLPFAGFAAMTIVMPESASAEEFSKNFNVESLAATDDWLKYKVELSMPKFAIESTLKMPDNVLSETGLSLAGAKNMLFGDLLSDKNAPSNLKQKTSLTINEDGAEMAAATSLTIFGSDLDVMKFDSVKLDVDRPFIYFITEMRTGAILMAVRICNL